ncbi:hypothetical protein [Nesterenkonia flava]|uniref:Uncharacterized protein n=1 Tax=Nesterenkonia flava TaxID=469799 RepID=A0ABU1FXP9_9MICC|nr:hypothetical protein [Nesterenkonia flava]MDR5713117.1 hypothetical protein [Nesterenkonia flava]
MLANRELRRAFIAGRTFSEADEENAAWVIYCKVRGVQITDEPDWPEWVNREAYLDQDRGELEAAGMAIEE